ncbi:MAG: hypothetical protein HYY06_27905 [Deltaproteobacteria bacterium]|nr:hypothetical protein [Deltaproteobacteria bacterium]
MQAAVIAIAALLAGCSCEEPRTLPREVYLIASPFCEDNLGQAIGPYLIPEAVSIDLAVVDVGTTDVGPVPVVARVPCANIEIPSDFDPADIFNAALMQISVVMDQLPVLPRDGGYGLVAGLYFDDPDCASGGSPPVLCAMSTAFGDLARSVWRLPPNGEQPPEDAIPLYLMCPTDGTACFDTGDCFEGEPPDGGTFVECASLELERCASDAPCRRGLTCGDAGFCEVEDGTCARPTGDGGVETCKGNACVAGAVCSDRGCFEPDGGMECLRGTCQDTTGLHLGGAGGYDERVTYLRCRSLHSSAFSGE